MKISESQLSQASKDNAPMKDTLSLKKKTSSTSAKTSAYVNTMLLAESLEMALRYGDEYMDENPITGHPGDFHLSTTGRTGSKATVPASTKGSLQIQTKVSASSTPDPKTIEPPRKGSKGDKSPKAAGMPKPRRRKSKVLNSAGGVSPT